MASVTCDFHLLSTVGAESCLLPVGAWPQHSIPGYIPDMSHVTMMSTLNRTLMKNIHSIFSVFLLGVSAYQPADGETVTFELVRHEGGQGAPGRDPCH